MSNLALWDKVCRPPKEALKEIKGGRLRGMTDINPQWRLKAMTEQFGPCGTGWKYTIDKLWTEAGPEGEVMAFALVSVYLLKASSPAKSGDLIGWNEPTPGIGGSAMVAKESGGLRANDEAYKMAVTDALSVAMKALGVAADIYAGLWDGSKYKDAPKELPESSKSIGKADLDKLPKERQSQLLDLATEAADLFREKGDQYAYDIYSATRDTLPPEEHSAFRGLFPSHIKTAFARIYEERKNHPKNMESEIL